MSLPRLATGSTRGILYCAQDDNGDRTIAAAARTAGPGASQREEEREHVDDLSSDIMRRLSVLNSAYYALYGASIEALKAEIGDGDRYANDVAVAVVSPRGGWCECSDLPAEFSGTTGPVECRFVSDDGALSLLRALEAASRVVAPENTRRLMIFVVYGRRGVADAREAFAFDYQCASGEMAAGPDVIGAFRPAVVPRFFRCRLDTDLDIAGTSVRRGVVAFIALPGERSAMIEMPQDEAGTWDIGAQPSGALTQ
jgi:hypothetical protein